jgi:hypothetical protein
VVREGQVVVEQPSLLLPQDHPYFEGFQFESDLHIHQDLLTSFLLVRGVRFPSFYYKNSIHHLDIFEGDLEKAARSFRQRLEREENVSTGLVTGPEDCWQFSVLIFISTHVLRSAPGDLKGLLDQLKNRPRKP